MPNCETTSSRWDRDCTDIVTTINAELAETAELDRSRHRFRDLNKRAFGQNQEGNIVDALSPIPSASNGDPRNTGRRRGERQ